MRSLPISAGRAIRLSPLLYMRAMYRQSHAPAFISFRLPFVGSISSQLPLSHAPRKTWGMTFYALDKTRFVQLPSSVMSTTDFSFVLATFPRPHEGEVAPTYKTSMSQANDDAGLSIQRHYEPDDEHPHCQGQRRPKFFNVAMIQASLMVTWR